MNFLKTAVSRRMALVGALGLISGASIWLAARFSHSSHSWVDFVGGLLIGFGIAMFVGSFGVE